MSATTRPWRTVAVAALAVVASGVPGFAEALWLPSASAPWWSWWTSHLVHHGIPHLLWDVAGFTVLGVVLERTAPQRWVATMLTSSSAVGAAMAFVLPDGAVFGGLSGLACALYAALACDVARTDRGLAGTMGALFVAKLVLEWGTGDALLAGGDGVVHVPLAHVVGALAGVVAAVTPRPRRVGADGREGLAG